MSLLSVFMRLPLSSLFFCPLLVRAAGLELPSHAPASTPPSSFSDGPSLELWHPASSALRSRSRVAVPGVAAGRDGRGWPAGGRRGSRDAAGAPQQGAAPRIRDRDGQSKDRDGGTRAHNVSTARTA